MADFEGYFAEMEARPWPEPLVSPGPRELEALRYVSHGLTWRQAAEPMGITPGSVHNSLKVARMKLGAKTTTHACCIALRLGLID